MEGIVDVNDIGLFLVAIQRLLCLDRRLGLPTGNRSMRAGVVTNVFVSGQIAQFLVWHTFGVDPDANAGAVAMCHDRIKVYGAHSYRLVINNHSESSISAGIQRISNLQ